MNKLVKRIKNYKPSKYICYLYFFIPIIVCVMLNVYKETDIFFLIKHGEYVLTHGFPTIEPFTIHQGFYFVMQQWLSATIFYLAHSFLGSFGLKLVLEIINCLILYFLYKICMLLSNNRFRLSVVCSCVTEILLLIFFVPRPWLFTFLFLIIELYILESFYINRNGRVLLLLPILSVLQINIQSSMWFMLYIFMLPYLVSIIIEKIVNKKDIKIYKLIIISIFMFLVGFINPYGIKNIFYIFNSYGNEYINKFIIEMMSPTIGSGYNIQRIYGLGLFFLITCIISILIHFKKGKMKLRHVFLLLGVTILALINIRSIPLFIIGSIPFLSAYLKDYYLVLTKNEQNFIYNEHSKKKYLFIIMFLCLYTLVLMLCINPVEENAIKKGVDKILETSDSKKAIVYTNYSNGSYIEYRGLKPYIDGRAEVFLKSNNHKEDIFKEYYLMSNGYINYKDFVNKYKFTHMIIMKNEKIYLDALKDKNYKTIYNGKTYRVFKFNKKT